MTCVGLAQRALDLAVQYAGERETFGKKIAKRQAIAFQLAEMVTDIQAARALVMQSATAWESGGDANAASAMSKLFAVSMLQRVTEERCRSTAGSATGPRVRSSASTATLARSGSRRARTRSRRP